MAATAKLFKHGGSQAVRLPKDFRFTRDEVTIEHVSGGVLLSTPETRLASLHAAYAEIDARRDPDDLFPYPPEPETDAPVSFEE